VSDQGGDQIVDSTDATNDTPEQDEIAHEEYPLTFRSIFFWGIVVFLGLLGTCVVVAIFLALMRGS
jgi:hypothetical protein